MKGRNRSIGFALAFALVAACSREEASVPQEPAAVSPEIASLVPADAFGFVRLASMNALEKKWREVEQATASKESALYGLLAKIEEGSQPVGRVHRAKPLGIALSFDDADDLVLTYVVAGTDGAYAAVRDGARLAPPSSPSPLAAKALDADVALRVDVKAIVERFREKIDAALSGEMLEGLPFPLGGPDPGETLGPALEVVRSLLDAAETVDLALLFDGTRVDFVASLTAKAGSAPDGARPPARSPLEIARLLPGGFPIEAAVSVDPTPLARWMSTFQGIGLASLPEETREAMRASMDDMIDLQGLLAGEAAMAMRFGGDDFALSMLQRARDAGTYVERFWDLQTKGNPLMTVEVLPETEVAGVRVRSFRTEMDLDALVGIQDLPPVFDDFPFFKGQRWSQAAVDDVVVQQMGGDEALVERMIRQVQMGRGTAPAGLARAAEKAGPGASVLARVDLRAAMSGIASMMGPMGQMMTQGMAEGGPVDLLSWFGAEGRVYRGGLSLDLAEIRALRATAGR